MNTRNTGMTGPRLDPVNSQIARSGFFADPCLLPGEDRRRYEDLLAAVTETMKPADILETIWVRDFVNLQWDIMRYQRISENYIQVRLKCIGPFEFPLGKKPTPDEELAHIVVEHLQGIQGLQRMVATMEARRNAAYREIDRHRSGLGARARAAAAEIEDAEFREIEDEHGEQIRAA